MYIYYLFTSISTYIYLLIPFGQEATLLAPLASSLFKLLQIQSHIATLQHAPWDHIRVNIF